MFCFYFCSGGSTCISIFKGVSIRIFKVILKLFSPAWKISYDVTGEILYTCFHILPDWLIGNEEE
jgi:hypothetical protein